MELKVCKNCRRLFQYIYGPELCQDCLKLMKQDQQVDANKEEKTIVKQIAKEDETQYGQIRDYIMVNPKATVAEIAEANDITPTKLLEWVRNDRLEFSEDSQYAWFECERCGAKIKSGRLCNRCKIR